MEKVSIIIPVYGVEAYLAECLESLINQTYENLEIIVVDDESPDQCPKICDEFAERDKRIIVIHQKNKGAAGARNTGLKKVSGDFVCFVDGDDIVKLNYVESLVSIMGKKEVDIAVCSFEWWYPNKRIPCKKVEFREYGVEEYLNEFLQDWTCGMMTNKLFRREILKGVWFKEGHKIDDEFFTYRVVMNAKNIVTVPDILYEYRMRASGVMLTYDKHREKMIRDRVEYLVERYEVVTEKFPQLSTEYLNNLSDNLISLKRESLRHEDLYKFVKNTMRSFFWKIFLSSMTWKKKYSFVYGMLFNNSNNENEKTQENELFQ
ncbi:MAG: glycosyltransferase family 2 protein [Anaerostipes sp.]|nr:glycosyltransferase family 2 protein [Anaerostipes sp.]